jgi:hypothetical protein
MRIVISEQQYRLLTEQTNELDTFMSKLINRYPEVENFKEELERFIINSGCKKIEFADFKHMALGAALHNGVLINNFVLSKPLSDILFVIFHEIAHQYQYKKYGEELMYQVYTDEISVEEAAKFMKNIEETADEFADRKCREFVKQGHIKSASFNKYYNKINLNYFVAFISAVKSELKSKQLKSPDEISSYFYNKLKSKIE